MIDITPGNHFSRETAFEVITKILGQLNHYLTKYPLSGETLKVMEWLVIELEKVRKIQKNDPRFRWLQLQSKMDALYQQDKSITGYTIQYDFNNTTKSKRAIIQLKHKEK